MVCLMSPLLTYSVCESLIHTYIHTYIHLFIYLPKMIYKCICPSLAKITIGKTKRIQTSNTHGNKIELVVLGGSSSAGRAPGADREQSLAQILVKSIYMVQW